MSDETTPAQDASPTERVSTDTVDAVEAKTVEADAFEAVEADAVEIASDESEPVTEDAARPPLPMLLESILLVVDEPASEVVLAQIAEAPRDAVVEGLHSLQAFYVESGRGFELREIAGGWRLYTHPDCAPWVERFVLDGQQARLTQAALETLAVIAYRQPVSRSRVAAVRGVNVDGVVRTLIARGLVEEAGQEESGAVLYGTTRHFLEKLGLTSLDDLPPLAPYLPEVEALDDEPDAPAAG